MNSLDEKRAMTWLTGRSRLTSSFHYLVLAVAWILLWRVSALMELSPHASLWFPPAALSLAALLLMGWRAIPVLMFCAVVVTFWTNRMYGGPGSFLTLLMSGLAFGLAHCASYGAGAALIRRMAGRSGARSVTGTIIVFLAAGCVSSLAAALSGIAALEWTGMLDRAAGPGLWLPWWIGDMAAVVVLTPLFLGLLSWRYPQIESWTGGLNFRPQKQGQVGFVAKLGLLLVLLSTVLLLEAHFRFRELAFAMFFLILPQMWIVYTESPFRSALSMAAFSTLAALWVAILGLADYALVYQFAICVIAASAYFGFAVPALIAQNRQLSEQVLIDGLTKAATKAHFFDVAERELMNARRYGLPISLMVLDIDRFKTINDSFGHAAGDRALVQLARLVQSQLRTSDLLGRFGGDEFTLLLPGINLEQATEMSDRLRELLRHNLIPGTDRHLSASFGVVSIDRNEDIMQAFNRADRKLLDAKHEGRMQAEALQRSAS
ncbi:MAG: diguanylate cyclase [Rhodanobacteraceae bacterium]